MTTYNLIILCGFMVAAVLNYSDRSMVLLSLAGLAILGLICPFLPSIDSAHMVAMVASFDLIILLFSLAIAASTPYSRGCYTALIMAGASFANLIFHAGAYHHYGVYGYSPNYYEPMLRSGEVLQLAAVLLRAQPTETLLRWALSHKRAEKTENGRRNRLDYAS